MADRVAPDTVGSAPAFRRDNLADAHAEGTRLSLYRTRKGLTLAQLLPAWARELAGSPGSIDRLQSDLTNFLIEDVVNCRLDNVGPTREDRALGLRLITPNNQAGYLEGHEARELLFPEGKEISPSDFSYMSNRLMVMKEAVLDFAHRHELPPPSWWTDATIKPRKNTDRPSPIYSKSQKTPKAYIPDWERLFDALPRVVATGFSKHEAQVAICSAMSDRKLRIRYLIGNEVIGGIATKRGYGLAGHVLNRLDIIPIHLAPRDLDWRKSRPNKPWQVLPNPVFWHLDWIEVFSADVTKVLCSGQQPWPRVETQSEPVSPPALKPAPEKDIRAAITTAYDAAQAAERKPPNIKELPAAVLPLLEECGYHASGRLIQHHGEAQEFKRRRRQPGKTISSEKRAPRK